MVAPRFRKLRSELSLVFGIIGFQTTIASLFPLHHFAFSDVLAIAGLIVALIGVYFAWRLRRPSDPPPNPKLIAMPTNQEVNTYANDELFQKVEKDKEERRKIPRQKRLWDRPIHVFSLPAFA